MMNDFIGFMQMVIMPIVISFVLLVTLFYYSSCREAEVFNKQNNTEWTCMDFFWAKDQIQLTSPSK